MSIADDEAEMERVFLGTALGHAPGLQEAADACRAAMSAADATEAEVEQAVLVLARDHVFPPSPQG